MLGAGALGLVSGAGAVSKGFGMTGQCGQVVAGGLSVGMATWGYEVAWVGWAEQMAN